MTLKRFIMIIFAIIDTNELDSKDTNIFYTGKEKVTNLHFFHAQHLPHRADGHTVLPDSGAFPVSVLCL